MAIYTTPQTNTGTATYAADDVFTGMPASGDVAALYNNAGTVTIDGSTFSDNELTGFANTGRAIIVGATFSSNSSTVSGGAIGSTSSFIGITNSIIDNNFSTVGSGIRIQSGTSRIDGSTLSNNRGSGALYISGGKNFVKGSLFEANDTTMSANSSTRYGAAIRIDSGTATIEDSTFTRNRGQNGTIYDKGKFSIYNSVFNANYTLTGGAAIVLNVATALGFSTQSRYVANTATSNGGAIANSGTFTSQGDLFADNISSNYGGAFSNGQLATLSGATFSANRATRGGAIYSIGVMTVSDSTFTANTATGAMGGGVFIVDVSGSSKTSWTASTTSIADSFFESNIASNGSAQGGVINNPGNLVTISGSTFRANRSGNQGGVLNNTIQTKALVIDGETTDFVAIGTVSVSETLFENNTASTGAVLANVNGAIANIDSSIFQNNTASGSGILYNTGDSQLNVTASLFSTNKAKAGAAIYNTGAASIDSSTFTNGIATNTGGAVHNSNTLNSSNSKYVSNTSSSGGGAIYGGTIVSQNDVFDRNLSGAGAGAIYLTVAGTVTGSTFSANTSTSAGGAINNLGSLSISGATFTGNTAGGANGGGAILAELSGSSTTDWTPSITNISLSVFDGNLTTRNSSSGGAIGNLGSTVTVSGSTFSANSSGAAGSGGAILNYESSKTLNGETVTYAADLSVSGSLFENNTSKEGAAVSNNGENAIAKFENTIFRNNHATSSGGAISNKAGTVTIIGCVFDGNSGSEGGAISNKQIQPIVGKITVQDSQFLTASDELYNGSGSTITLQGTVTTCASIKGAGVYYANGVYLVFAGSTATTISALRATGDGITGLTFANTAAVTFSSQSFANKAITIDTGNVWTSGTTTFATGISNLTSATFTVNGRTAELDTPMVNGSILSFADNTLTLTVTAVTVDNTNSLDAALAATAVDAGAIVFANETDGETCTFSGASFTHDQVFQGNGAENTTIQSADASIVYANGNDLLMDSLAWNGILYGGAKNADTTGASLSFQDTAIGGNVFGGGRAENGSDVSMGTVSLTIADSAQATGKAVYGGGYANGGSATIDSIALTLDNVTGGNSVYGGGAVNGGGKLEVGPVATAISGGVYGAVYNGANIYTSGTGSEFTAGAMSLDIDGGTFTGAVGNGSTPRSGATSTQGASTITISDGLFQGIVYGGAASFGGDATVASTTVTISGGTFNGKVFGGNVGLTGAKAANASLTGDANLTVDSSTASVCFNGNVFGGSMGTGNIGGNVTVTFKGDGDNLTFGDSAFLSGASEYAFSTTDYVEGIKTLVFDGFSGAFNANIQGPAFEAVTVKNGSQVNVCDGAVNQDFGFVSTWNFELSDAEAVMITDDEDAANVKNSFYGDTINLTFAAGASVGNTDWTIYQGSEDTLANWNNLGGLTIGGVAATGTMDGDFMAWSTTEYKVYVDSNYDIRLAKLA